MQQEKRPPPPHRPTSLSEDSFDLETLEEGVDRHIDFDPYKIEMEEVDDYKGEIDLYQRNSINRNFASPALFEEVSEDIEAKNFALAIEESKKTFILDNAKRASIERRKKPN